MGGHLAQLFFLFKTFMLHNSIYFSIIILHWETSQLFFLGHMIGGLIRKAYFFPSSFLSMFIPFDS